MASDSQKQCARCHNWKWLPDDFYYLRGKPMANCRDCQNDTLDFARAVNNKAHYPDGKAYAGTLKEQVDQLIAAKGFRRPEYVARILGITVESATKLMFDAN